eukprot:1143406-Rhodomonas_salina.1
MTLHTLAVSGRSEVQCQGRSFGGKYLQGGPWRALAGAHVAVPVRSESRTGQRQESCTGKPEYLTSGFKFTTFLPHHWQPANYEVTHAHCVSPSLSRAESLLLALGLPALSGWSQWHSAP